MIAAALILAVAIVLHPFAQALAERIRPWLWPKVPKVPGVVDVPPLPPLPDVFADPEAFMEKLARGIRRGMEGGEGWKGDAP